MCQKSAVRACRPPLAQARRDQREVIVLEEDRGVGRRHLLSIAAANRALTADTPPSPPAGTSAARRRDGTAATALRWRSRRSTRRTRPVESTAGASAYAGRSGGTRILSFASTTLAIGSARAVRDPHAAPLAHQRIERHGHAAGRRRARDACRQRRSCAGTARGWTRRAAAAGALRVDFARSCQAGAEQRRSDELVDGDQGDEQHLHLRAPRRELGRHEPRRGRA